MRLCLQRRPVADVTMKQGSEGFCLGSDIRHCFIGLREEVLLEDAVALRVRSWT